VHWQVVDHAKQFANSGNFFTAKLTLQIQTS